MNCKYLRKVVADRDQRVAVRDSVEIVEYTLPIKAPRGIYDTQEMYLKENISFGTNR